MVLPLQMMKRTVTAGECWAVLPEAFSPNCPVSETLRLAVCSLLCCHRSQYKPELPSGHPHSHRETGKEILPPVCPGILAE